MASWCLRGSAEARGREYALQVLHKFSEVSIGTHKAYISIGKSPISRAGVEARELVLIGQILK